MFLTYKQAESQSFRPVLTGGESTWLHVVLLDCATSASQVQAFDKTLTVESQRSQLSSITCHSCRDSERAVPKEQQLWQPGAQNRLMSAKDASSSCPAGERERRRESL